MRVPTQRLFFVVSLVLLAGPVSSQEAGPTGPNPYDIISGWPTSFAGAGFAWGGNSGVYAESPDRIIVLQRGDDCRQGQKREQGAENKTMAGSSKSSSQPNRTEAIKTPIE